MKKIFFALPIHRYIEPDARASIEKAIYQHKGDWSVGEWRELYHESLISRARNNLAKMFMDSDSDYLLFIDSDIVLIEPATAIDLLVGFNDDVVAGLYVFKDYPHKPAVRFYGEPDIKKLPIVMTVEYASCGFMAIKRKVFKNLEYPFMPMVVNKEYLSEDWAFCKRARDNGFNIYVRTDIKLGHIGNYLFTLNDHLKLKERGV